jgi:hypothetical protein
MGIRRMPISGQTQLALIPRFAGQGEEIPTPSATDGLFTKPSRIGFIFLSIPPKNIPVLPADQSTAYDSSPFHDGNAGRMFHILLIERIP